MKAKRFSEAPWRYLDLLVYRLPSWFKNLDVFKVDTGDDIYELSIQDYPLYEPSFKRDLSHKLRALENYKLIILGVEYLVKNSLYVNSNNHSDYYDETIDITKNITTKLVKTGVDTNMDEIRPYLDFIYADGFIYGPCYISYDATVYNNGVHILGCTSNRIGEVKRTTQSNGHIDHNVFKSIGKVYLYDTISGVKQQLYCLPQSNISVSMNNHTYRASGELIELMYKLIEAYASYHSSMSSSINLNGIKYLVNNGYISDDELLIPYVLSNDYMMPALPNSAERLFVDVDRYKSDLNTLKCGDVVIYSNDKSESCALLSYIHFMVMAACDIDARCLLSNLSFMVEKLSRTWNNGVVFDDAFGRDDKSVITTPPDEDTMCFIKVKGRQHYIIGILHPQAQVTVLADTLNPLMVNNNVNVSFEWYRYSNFSIDLK